MLDKMFDEDIYDDGRSNHTEELLAKGQYESDPEQILNGFKVFQKKYVYKGVVFQLVLVVLAIASQVLTIVSDTSGDVMMPVVLIIVCVFLGVNLALRPFNTMKNLRKGIQYLTGTIYEAEIYNDKIKIITVYDAPLENGETVDTEKLAESDKKGLEAVEEARVDNTDDEEEYDGPPATIIHLDSHLAEIIETDELYIVYVKKVNIFVIPKNAFKPYEVQAVNEKLSNIMGVRFKGLEC